MPNLIESKWRKSNPVKNNPVCWFLLCLFIYSPSLLANNPLQNHPSPYIRLHAHDAVQWQLWSESIIQQARRENKLIFVSIGYFACHWCHVMREESFNDPIAARLLNENFIPVKVDRELNPALDDYLMDFLQKTRGYGGWPLNVFVTPQGYPLLGLVYAPQPDFVQVLQGLQSEWQKDTVRLNKLALDAFEFSKQMNAGVHAIPDAKELDFRFMQALLAIADELQGGLGHQAKFPQPSLLLILLNRYQQQTDHEWLRDYLQLTLKQIASKGLHDVIGGGFFRYTVDPDWQTPHFEKMLYTNAGLVQVYVRAFEVFGDSYYLDVAVETVEFMLRELQHESGGFISSLSAQDSQGVEGGSYVWTREELQNALSADQWQQVNKVWQFYQLQDSQMLLPVGMAQQDRWREIRLSLMQKRNTNSSPKDEKIVASWNGYTLSALAKLYAVKPQAAVADAGDRLFDLLLAKAKKGLTRTLADEHRRYLDDYAFVSQGLLDWRDTRKKSDIDVTLKKLLNRALAIFKTEDGWRLSDDQLLPLPSDKLVIADGDLPSPAVVLMNAAERIGIKHKFNINRVDRYFLADPLGHASTVEFYSRTRK